MRALPSFALLLAGLLVASSLTARVATERSTHAALQEPAKQEPPAKEKSEARDADEVRVELAAAQRKLQLAFAHNRLAKLEAESEMEAAVTERVKTQAALNSFETHEQGARVAESDLELQHERDGAQDARDEMEQLAALYGQGDLAEKTAELVIRRAERSLERAQESLRLMEAGHRQLLNVTLPRELFELRQAVAASERAVRMLEAQQEVSELEFADEVATLEAEITALKAELAPVPAPDAAAK